jgi:tetratricopeptide (TPR) repeat protein
MAIRGNLSEASLADVLQLLALGQKTGCLSVAREGSFGTVHFDRGRIAHAAIVNRRDRLGDRLVRSGAMAADALALAIAGVTSGDDRELAHSLLAARLVDHEVLMSHYRAQVEEAVYHLFAWNTGTFTFEADAETADEPLLSISADTLLLEGARRVDEWTLIEKKIPSLDLIFEVDTKRLAQSDVSLSPVQERLVLLLDGANDIHALVERSGIDEFEVGKAVYGLITAGFAQRVGRSAARRQPPPFYRTGMLDEAQREFRRVLELRDADASARFHIALVHLRRGEWQDAADTLHRAAQEPDAPAAVFHNLAFALERLGRLDEASAALKDASARAPVADPRTALSEAVIALHRGELALADDRLSAARAAWGSRQPSAAWYHAAGLAAALAGDGPRAIAILDEGLSLHPHAAVLHNNLAVVHERRGAYELAARTLEHALLEDANRAHLHKNLGDYLYRAQRYDEAFDSLTRVVRLDAAHGADVYLKLGNIHYRRGAMDDARLTWERALEIDPNNRIVRANLDALRRAEPATISESTGDAALVGHAA